MTALTEEFETKLKKIKIKNKNGFSKADNEGNKSNSEPTKEHN